MDPGARPLCISGHQVQGLDPSSEVDAEATVGIKAVVGIPPKHL